MNFFSKLNYKYVSGALLLLLVAAVFLNQSLESKKELDLTKLDKSLAKYYDTLASSQEEIKYDDAIKTDLISLHSSMFSYVAQKSIITSALIAYDEKRLDDAISLYLLLIKKHSSSYLADIARMNLAYLYEEQGNKPNALKYFTDLSKRENQLLIFGEATFNLARLNEESNLEESVKLYTKITNKLGEENIWLKLAQNRLIALGKL